MRISETAEFQVPVGLIRPVETAFRNAQTQALLEFGIDEDGHSTKVPKWERFDSSIKLKLLSIIAHGGPCGWYYVARFEAWCEKANEEEK